MIDHSILEKNTEKFEKFSLEELRRPDGLRLARRRHGLSQVELADLLKISQSNISRWENGYESIPWRMSVAMAEIFKISRERSSPYLRRLAEVDWRVSVLQFEKNGFLLDSRILHLSKNLAAFFDIHETESHGALSSNLFDPTWRPAVYGSQHDPNRISIEFERDCVSLSRRRGQASCRLRSQQYMIDCDGFAQAIFSISTILGPGTGEPPRVHSMVQIGDLPVLPQSKGIMQKVRKRISSPTAAPMMMYDFKMGVSTKG